MRLAPATPILCARGHLDLHSGEGAGVRGLTSILQAVQQPERVGQGLLIGEVVARPLERGGDTERGVEVVGLHDAGEATVGDAIDLDTDLVRLRRGPAEAEGVDALVAPRRQGDGGDLRDVARRDGLGLDLDGDESPWALESGL